LGRATLDTQSTTSTVATPTRARRADHPTTPQELATGATSGKISTTTTTSK